MVRLISNRDIHSQARGATHGAGKLKIRPGFISIGSRVVRGQKNLILSFGAGWEVIRSEVQGRLVGGMANFKMGHACGVI